ncbi:MAG: bifunctional UDP-N-acetylglucosamine diphosphorylase/glucosamine-1-phosphate N-acetyltransferase GlmU [Chloroflexi bacterium]|nr:bifunctional UDP-N-acetylglucosamine diphosphorylase/glucosamine-1-phosphate N-acetyltransferase GlmU [Chloroflexota bacterium]
MNTLAVVLAAGMGTRMKSKTPKVLHRIAGRPMVMYAVRTAAEVTGATPVVVVGHERETVQAVVGDAARFVLQGEQRGTGHAVLVARDALREADTVIVLYGDTPFVKPDTLRRLIELHVATNAKVSPLTVVSDDSMAFGRITRDAGGQITGIVEEAVATPEQLRIRELNCGIYCFDAAWLWANLPALPLRPKGEYYLTDTVELAVRQGERIASLTIDDIAEVIGINDRVLLARAEKLVRAQIRERWMRAGVTLADPDTTYIDADVEIARDVTILPNTHLQGACVIGEDAVIGPNSIVRDSRIGARCVVTASVVEEAVMDDDANIGPYSHLRPGAQIGSFTHLGNFVEVKNSTVGRHVSVGHFSYIGDATLGDRVNIGAGTITMNYDGVRKNHTEIGDDAFIGCDSLLRAPVTVGAGATTGGGSVVTKDVPPRTVAVGMPARVIRRKDGA